MHIKMFIIHQAERQVRQVCLDAGLTVTTKTVNLKTPKRELQNKCNMLFIVAQSCGVDRFIRSF